jgi:hypothetical protein
MADSFVVFLIPTILILGTFMIYRSYQSIDSYSARALHPIQNQSDDLVNVEFFVMSKCPDAIKCETLFLPSLLKLSSIVNFTLSFIASEPRLNDFKCPHGIDECTGNRQQLCIQNMYSQTMFIKYLLCQSKQILMIPDNGEECAKQSSNNIINWSDVQSCVTTMKSNQLFHNSLERTRASSVQKSCTMHINGRLWCMHDGYWLNCLEGQDPKSFIKSICSRYHGKNSPIECRN